MLTRSDDCAYVAACVVRDADIADAPAPTLAHVGPIVTAQAKMGVRWRGRQPLRRQRLATSLYLPAAQGTEPSPSPSGAGAAPGIVYALVDLAE